MNRLEIRKKYCTENGKKHLARVETCGTYTRWLEKELSAKANRLDALVSKGEVDVLLAEDELTERPGCSGCDNYFNNWSETFGDEPHCHHKPKPTNIDAVADGEEKCEYRETKLNKQDTDEPSK